MMLHIPASINYTILYKGTKNVPNVMSGTPIITHNRALLYIIISYNLLNSISKTANPWVEINFFCSYFKMDFYPVMT